MSETQTQQVKPVANPAEPPVVARFRDLFNGMSSGNLGELARVYSDRIRFTDPFKTVHGLDELMGYFEGAYANVIDCRFEFGDTLVDGDQVCLTWVMKLRHKRIRRGELIEVDGISRLELKEDLITLHRDYFDAGQLLYENLPVLGSAVRWLRRYAA
ncbi:MAG: nuclear transport factor 2 family protein [Marinobacter sp.]|uniref:nuclear transport factor 2 family protein n=1 Tax=Marinobacter sp. TaxID=50741 RepID=UPI00299DB15F|nr:nuclear transport factor 2 family protein [Marinobacter sp.]MDX1634364.1 nuclear transport factor 2 family protein [Marinobacter sp.]